MIKPSIITLGTFDGVHRGHQAILKLVVLRSKVRQARSVAMTFDMPPRHAGERNALPVLLSTLAEKKILMSKLGISQMDVLRFNKRTASTTPEDFFSKVIVKKHSASEIVVGPKLAFGRHRAGRLPLLRKLGKASGIKVHVVAPVREAGWLSSRGIRKLLYKGKVESAAKRLGYVYSVSGAVVKGEHRGRRLGYPTANIRPDAGKILPQGVFWVKVVSPNEVAPNVQSLIRAPDGLCNVGIRPTFKEANHELHCEVFVFKGKIPTYGKRLRVVFLRRLRGEKRFKTPEALKRQIASDLLKGKRWANQTSLLHSAFSL